MKKKVYEVKGHETIGYALTYCVDRISPNVLYYKGGVDDETSAVGLYKLFFLIDNMTTASGITAVPSIGKARYTLSTYKAGHKYGLIYEGMFTPRLWWKDKEDKARMEDLYFRQIKEDGSIAYRIIEDAIMIPQDLGHNYNPSKPFMEKIIVSELTLEHFAESVLAHLHEISTKGSSGFQKTQIEYLNIDTIKFLNGLLGVELRGRS